MNDPILQEIKDRLNVADVISGYIPIKKAGVNFKAPCPFHNEKTPSLVISPQKQIWHCFGCGEGGDVFGFVRKMENVEFKDALKILADKAGVKLPTYRPENKEVQDEKEFLYRINDFAARYYNQILTSSQTGKEALEYLKNRGLSEGTIKNWQIGFAPDDFHALERALTLKKVSIADSIKAGVSAKNERGQMYDRFRGRITFPIYNYFGETVGFSARLLKENPNAGKYINSPETAIYNKSKILFGLNFAKDSIRKKDEAVIVEGQMDCISAHQAGFANTVASSGTALTEQQLQQLGRLTKNLKFCFDGDSAGLAAARRAGEMALKDGFRLKMIILQNVSSFAEATADAHLSSDENKWWAKDPDELIKKSPGLWEKAVSEAIWFLDYYIDFALSNFPAGSVEQKMYLSKEVVPFLNFIGDPLEQDHYIKKLVDKFSITEKVIREQLKGKSANQLISGSVNQPNSQSADQPVGRGLLLQKEVLGGMLYSEEFLQNIASQLEPADFEDAEVAEIVKQLVTPPSPPSERGGRVKDSTLAKEAIFMVESQLDELAGDTSRLIKSLEKSFSLLKLTAIKRKQESLQTEIKNAENAGNKVRVDELNKNFAEILKQRAGLENDKN